VAADPFDRVRGGMSDQNNKDESKEISFSDSVELFDDIFREEIDADSSNSDNMHLDSESDLPNDLPGEEEKETTDNDIKDIAVKFWRYLNKDSRETFLDADIKDASRAVLSFINQDIVGKKIVLLEDDKLRTVNVVARTLKRKRKIIKTDKEKDTIAQVKKIYQYLNNPFWQNGSLIRNARKYLDKNLRKMTPSIIQNLNSNVEKLRTYFSGVVLDNRIFNANKELKQMSVRFGYRQYAVCEKHQQPLAKNETGDIICNYTHCGAKRCPFEACKAHGQEITFLSNLTEFLKTTNIIGNNSAI